MKDREQLVKTRDKRRAAHAASLAIGGNVVWTGGYDMRQAKHSKNTTKFQTKEEPNMNTGIKTCKACGEVIKRVAKKCCHCGTDLSVSHSIQQTGNSMMGAGCALMLLVPVVMIVVVVLMVGGC